MLKIKNFVNLIIHNAGVELWIMLKELFLSNIDCKGSIYFVDNVKCQQ